MGINIINLDAPTMGIETTTESVLFDLAICEMYNIKRHGFNSCRYSVSERSRNEMIARLALLGECVDLFNPNLLEPLLEDLKSRFSSTEGREVVISSLDEHLLISMAYRLEYMKLDGGFVRTRFSTNRQKAVVEELGLLEDHLAMSPLFTPLAVEVVCELRSRFMESIS